MMPSQLVNIKMKSPLLNVTIDPDTREGARLRDMILSTEFDKGWLCCTWVERTKFNHMELLKQSEAEKLDLQNKLSKAWAWIEKAIDLMVCNNLHDPEDSCGFAKLIDEAPI